MGPQDAGSDEQGSRPCFCGSRKPSDWLRDDQDGEVARVCDDCRERILFAYECDIAPGDMDDADDQELVDMVDMDSLQEDES